MMVTVEKMELDEMLATATGNGQPARRHGPDADGGLRRPEADTVRDALHGMLGRDSIAFLKEQFQPHGE